MSLFMPSIVLKNVTDIQVELLQRLEIQSILLDVDNTLAHHGSPKPLPGVVEWTRKIRQAGISIIIVSNNFKNRVAPFAKKFELPFVSLALKPMPFGFNRAKKLLKEDCNHTLVVGDQIFTDVLGANLAGMKSILLEPAVIEKTLGFRLRRILENPIRSKIKRQENK